MMDRVLYGPRPPIGRPYTPKAHWRCLLGLHRSYETWEFTLIGEIEDVEENRRGLRVAIRLDREPDYLQCVWCKRLW